MNPFVTSTKEERAEESCKKSARRLVRGSSSKWDKMDLCCGLVIDGQEWECSNCWGADGASKEGMGGVGRERKIEKPRFFCIIDFEYQFETPKISKKLKSSIFLFLFLHTLKDKIFPAQEL